MDCRRLRISSTHVRIRPIASQANSRAIRECPHCGASLLACDYVGRSALQMTHALNYHGSGLCVESPSAAGERAMEDALAPAAASDFTNLAPWIDEEPPLTFCTRHGLSDLAHRVLHAMSGDSNPSSIDHISPSGFAALHYAAALGDATMIRLLLAAGASPLKRSQDSCANDSCAGGQLPLHMAASSGHAAAVRLLLEASPSAACAVDWDGYCSAACALLATDGDGRTPPSATTTSELANLASILCEAADRGAAALDAAGGEADEIRELVAEVRIEVAEAGSGQRSGQRSGQQQPTDGWLQRRQRARRLRLLGRNERERERLCIRLRPELRSAHLLSGLLTPAECSWLVRELVDASALHGWQSGRHRHYATEDMPLWRAPRAASWVRAMVRTRIFPCLAAAFGIDTADLRLQELFVVRYEPSGQANLRFHRDSTLLSFNVALSEAYEGGGTCFAEEATLCEWEPRGSDDGCTTPSTPSAAAAADAPSTAPFDSGCLEPIRAVLPGMAATGQRAINGGDTVRGARGDCLIHCGQVLHGGGTVSSGMRMIVVGFVSEIVHCGAI